MGWLLRASVADATNSSTRGLMHLPGQRSPRNLLRKRSRSRPFRHIARGGKQRGVFTVQIGKFGFRHYMVMDGARDIPGAAGAGTVIFPRLVHGCRNGRVQPHARTIIGATDCQIARSAITTCVEKRAAIPFKFGKLAMITALSEVFRTRAENPLIVCQKAAASATRSARNSSTLSIEPCG